MSRLPQILLSILTFTAILNFSICHTDEQKDNAAKNRVWTLEVANSVRKYDPSFGVHNQKHKSFKGDELRLHQPTGFPEYDLFKGAVDYYEKQRAKPGDEPEPEEAPKKRNIKLPAVFTTKVLNPKNVDSKDFIALIAAFGHTYLDAGIWNWLNKEPKVLYKFLTKKGYTIEGGSGKKSERTGDRKELNSADIEVLKEMLDKAKAFIKEESMILGLPVETEKKEDQFLSDDLLTEGLTSSSVEMDRNEVLEPTKIYPSLSPAVRFPNYNITPKITKDKEKHNKEKLALLVKSLYLLDLGLYLSRRAMNPKKPLPKKATVANPTVENPMEFFVYVEINEMIKKIRDLDPKKENKEVWGRLCVYDRDNPNAKQLKQSVEITIPEMLRTRKIKTGQELVDVMHMIVNPLRLHTLRDWIAPAIRYERYAKKALNFLKEHKYSLTSGVKWQTVLQQAKTIVEKNIEITEEDQAIPNKHLHMTPIGDEKHNKTYELLLKITALFFKEQRHGAAESGAMPEIYFGELQDAYGEFLGHSYFKKLSKVMRKLRGAREYLRKSRQVDRWLLGEFKWLEKYVKGRIDDKSTIREPIITEIEDELQADDYGTPKENKDAVRLAKLMIMVKDVLTLNKATVVDLYPDQLDLFTSAIYIYAESYKDYQTKKKKKNGTQSRSPVRSLSHTDNLPDTDDPYHHLKTVGESIIGTMYSLIENQCRAFYATLDEKFGHDDVLGLLIAKETLRLLSKPLLNWHKYFLSTKDNQQRDIIVGPDGKPGFGKLLLAKENAFGHIEWDLGENIEERMEVTEDLIEDLLKTHNIKFDDEEDFDEHERLIWHSVCNFSFGMIKGSYSKVEDADKLYGVLHAHVLGLVIEDRPFQGKGGNLHGQANDMFREWLGALTHYPKVLTEKVKVYLMAKNVELTDPTLLSERGIKQFEERYANVGETQKFKTVFKNQRNEGIVRTVINCAMRMKKKGKNNEDAHVIDTFHQKLLIAGARIIKEARKKAGGNGKTLHLLGVDVINDIMDSVEPFIDNTRAEGLYTYYRYYDEHTKKKSRKAFHKEQLAFVTKVEKQTWKGIDALNALLKGSRRSGIKRTDFDQITLFLLAKDELDMEFKQSFMVTLYQLKDIAAVVEEYVKRIKDKPNDVHSHEGVFQDFRGKLAKTIASIIVDPKETHDVTQQELKSKF